MSSLQSCHSWGGGGGPGPGVATVPDLPGQSRILNPVPGGGYYDFRDLNFANEIGNKS